MGTIADIPVELLEPVAREMFKNWLNGNVADAPVKRGLIHRWRLATGATWHKEDYEDCGLHLNE